jgi:hypothetical protein
VVFRVGRSDAEATSRAVGRVDPGLIDPETGKNLSFATQWELWTQGMQTLPGRHALVKYGQEEAVRVRTLAVPRVKISAVNMEQVLMEYSRLYLREVVDDQDELDDSDDALQAALPEQPSLRQLWRRRLT